MNYFSMGRKLIPVGMANCLKIIGFMLVLGGRFAQAETSVDLNWALKQTLNNNLTLRAAPYQLKVGEGELLQASQSPAPKIGLTVENVWGDGEFSGTDSAEISLTLGQTLELGGKRDSRVAVASANLKQQQLSYELNRLDILAETSRRYYNLLQLQAQQDWLARRINTERQALTVISKRANSGAIGQADVSKMQLRLSRSQVLSQKLNGELEIARMALASMWSSKPSFTRVQGSLMALPPIPDAAQITQLVSESPQLQLQQTLLRLSEARLMLAQSMSQSDVNVAAGIRHFEARDEQAVVLEFSMPLAFESYNRGNIAAAQSAKELSQFEADQMRQQLQLSLLSSQRLLTHQRQHAQRIATILMPQAHQLLKDTELGYLNGRYSVLQWVDAQAEQFALEQELIATYYQIYLQLLELERITGHSLSTAV